MTQVASYLETESFPRGRRLLLTPLACLLLVGPYGTLLSGDAGAVTWAIAAFAVAVGAGLLGVSIAQPRRTFTADGATRELEIVQTAELPRVKLDRVTRSFDDVGGTSIEEVGTVKRPDHGFRPVITLRSGERITLRRQREREQAQNVIDHLVLLGLPGMSRAEQREAELHYEPPTTWL